MLLFWSKDVAQGRGLAAVKFDSLVKIDTVRVVPSGIAPFAAVPQETGFVVFALSQRLWGKCSFRVILMRSKGNNPFSFRVECPVQLPVRRS